MCGAPKLESGSSKAPNMATSMHSVASFHNMCACNWELRGLVPQFPHLSGLIGQPLIDGSSRELTGAQRPFAAPISPNPAQKAGWAHLPPSAWRVASIAWRSASACEIGGPGFVSAS